MDYSIVSNLIDNHKNLISYQWMKMAFRYLGVKRIKGKKSNPIIVQFIATTLGVEFKAKKPNGNFLNVSNSTVLHPACYMGLEFSHPTDNFNKVAHDNMEWCASFVNFILVNSGFKGSTGENMGARSFENWGRKVNKEEIGNYFGAITVFSRPPTKNNKRPGHVGFYVGEDDEKYFILGGNQGGQSGVTISGFPKEKGNLKFLGFRWPSS